MEQLRLDVLRGLQRRRILPIANQIRATSRKSASNKNKVEEEDLPPSYENPPSYQEATQKLL